MNRVGFSVRSSNETDIIFVNDKIQESLTEDETHSLIHHATNVLSIMKLQTD